MNTLEHLTLRLYRRLARAFPEEFQHTYGAEMVDAAEDTVPFTGSRAGMLSRLVLLMRLVRLHKPTAYPYYEEIWPGDEPVGKTVDFDGARWQVIGVVGDIRPALPLAPTLPAVFRPMTPAGFATPSAHGVTVLVRVVPGFDAPARIRAEVDALDPRVTVRVIWNT